MVVELSTTGSSLDSRDARALLPWNSCCKPLESHIAMNLVPLKEALNNTVVSIVNPT